MLSSLGGRSSSMGSLANTTGLGQQVIVLKPESINISKPHANFHKEKLIGPENSPSDSQDAHQLDSTYDMRKTAHTHLLDPASHTMNPADHHLHDELNYGILTPPTMVNGDKN